MKLNKTIKKLLAVVMSLSLVITSITISGVVTKADEWSFKKAEVSINDDKDQYKITVEYDALNGANPDTYWYSVYLDQVDDEHLGVAYGNNWNWWAERYSYPGKDNDGNPVYGMVAGRHTFDNVYKTASGEKLGLGETHKIIVVAYERTAGATLEEDQFTEVGRVEQEFTTPDSYPAFSDEENEIRDTLASFTDAKRNLALGKEGFTSWTEGVETGLTDGNLADGPQSGLKAENDFFGVNLGEVKTVGGVAVKWEAACSNEYDIYTSLDGNEYTKVASATLTDTKNFLCKTTFTAVDAQYIKVVQTKPSDLATAWGMHPYEIVVYAGVKGENPETTTEAPETTTEAPETTTEAPETTETTTEAPETTEAPKTTTEAPETTEATETTTETPETTKVPVTTQAPTTTKKPTKKVLKKTKITKATRKSVKAKKIKLTFKRVKNANKYKVEVSTSKKFKKVLLRKTVKKVSVTITGKALKNKKKLFVRVREVGATKWAVKQVKIKK